MRYFILFSMLHACFFAQIQLSTDISEGDYRGECVKTGSLSLTFTGDLFPLASPEAPQYLRISLPDKGTKLCQTLVEIEGSSLVHQPISLALSTSSAAEVVAPSNALTLVRWRQGESAIWLKVTSPSSQWLQDENTYLPPSENAPVRVTLGLNAEEILSYSNLAANEHHNQAYLAMLEDSPATTELRLNLSDSSLGSSGEQSLLRLSLDLWDATTLGVEDLSEITLGLELPYTSTGDAVVLRGKEAPQYSHQMICPWVSWNEQYDTEVLFNNRSASPCALRLTIRRENGDTWQTSFNLESWQTLRSKLGDLFPELTRGFGATLEIEYTDSDLSVTWNTYLRAGCSGYAPASARAITTRKPYLQTQNAHEYGPTLAFGNLISDPNFFPAIVLVNLGSEALDATLLFVDADGSSHPLSTTAGQGLQPLRPRAILIRELFPDGEVPPFVMVHADGKMCGVAFLFNNNGEPAMSPAEAFQRPIPALLPAAKTSK